MSLASSYVKICTGWLILLGIVGLLLTGFTGPGRSLVWMEIDSVASWIHLIIGLVGTAMLTTSARARRFAMFIGPLLVAWGLLGLLTDGSPGDWATGDTQTVGMHLILGIAGVAAAWAPSAMRSETSS